MSASLVGSEMCIRDRRKGLQEGGEAAGQGARVSDELREARRGNADKATRALIAATRRRAMKN
eukprot:11447730-Alexandrium_andersonii.AAC.1